MATTLTIKDETTFNFGKPDYVFTIRLTGQRLTARDLIRERVKQEVEEFNAQEPEHYHGLVQPTDAERTLNGFKLKNKRKLDWQEQFNTAIEGFSRNAFILLVDDLQVEDLDQPIKFHTDSVVTFLKLVPLAGG